MEGRQRRLHGILAADVVGYSALMEADEDETVRSLQGCREVFDGIIEDFSGRIITTAGDSVIAVFSSVFDAVDCATEAQTALSEYNADNPESPQIRFRMGINVGDLMITGSDTLGNAINVAARLESVADPGGVFISDSVYRLVRDKPDIQFQDRGAFGVKNISEPLHAYSVGAMKDADADADATIVGGEDKKTVFVGCDVVLATQRGPYYLRFGDTVKVGRSRHLTGADIVVGFRRASQVGKQALVKISGDGIVVVDCGSTNGTFVNNTALAVGEEMTIPLSDAPAELCLGGLRTPPVKGPCRFILEPFRSGELAVRFRLTPETRRLVGDEGMRTEWPDSERDFAATWLVATGGLLIGASGECAIAMRDLPGKEPRARLAPHYRGFMLAPMNGAKLTVDGHPVRGEINLTDGAKIVLDGVAMQFRLL